MYSRYIKNIKNEYNILQKLGSTGNSFLVEHKISHKQSVAKIYDEWKTDEDQQSFLNEIDFRVSEQYPELLPIKALNLKDFNDRNRPTIITDFMEKGSLEDNFNDLTPVQKYILLYSIANCLEFLHKNKISHLNLKPSNILLDPSYYPRITDYYGYKTHKLNEMIDNRIGLSLYMDPEVIYNKKFGPKADIYSYGIIAYEILTNDRSFTNMINNFGSFDDIPRNIMPNLSLITNAHLRDLVMKCISIDQKDRPTAGEIINLLEDKQIEKDMGVKFQNFQSYFNFQCLERAKKKDPEAMNRIACMRDYAKADLNEILFYYDEAINCGNTSAMFNKSSMLYFGRNCTKNIEESLKLMKMAVDNHNSNAMTNYGSLLFYGVGVPRDIEDGLFYLNSARKLNNSFAMLNLAVIYLNGYSVPKNIEKALQLFKQATDLKNTDALVELAKLYLNGEVVPKNLDEAIRLLKIAVDLYSNEAKCLLAKIYTEEESVKDENEALRLLEEAIKDGYTKADLQKENLKRHIKTKFVDDGLIDVGYVDFFDGLPIEKPKLHHITYLKKSDYTLKT